MNKYTKMKTDHLLEFLVICTPIKWLLLIMCVVFFAIGDMAAAMRIIVGIYAIFLFFYMNSSKKKVEKELENREYSEIDKQNAAKKGKKRLIFIVCLLALGLLLYSCELNGSNSSSNKPWEELGVSEREYMETYYHIAEGMPR